ncbi:MAG TPA: hypothetical protein VFR08_02140 [Candidatus Angelobacter sp.]|nr:hypothetical protein [Candidatus Angelobacter sp.]
MSAPGRGFALSSETSTRSRDATSKITLERYTQAVSSNKRAAQEKLVRMVIGDKRYSELQAAARESRLTH